MLALVLDQQAALIVDAFVANYMTSVKSKGLQLEGPLVKALLVV